MTTQIAIFSPFGRVERGARRNSSAYHLNGGLSFQGVQHRNNEFSTRGHRDMASALRWERQGNGQRLARGWHSSPRPTSRY